MQAALIYTRRKCGRSHLDINKSFDAVSHGKLLVKEDMYGLAAES